MGRKNKSYHHFSHQHLYPYLHMGISLIPRYHSNLGSLDTNYIVFINDEFFKINKKSPKRKKNWVKEIYCIFKNIFFQNFNELLNRQVSKFARYIYIYVCARVSWFRFLVLFPWTNYCQNCTTWLFFFCFPHLTTPLERLPKTCFEALEQTIFNLHQLW